ncbi:MAG: hypothetical protein R3E68_07535 [Burkholderiaceae bacterium]
MLKSVTRTMSRRIGWLTFWLGVGSVVLGMIGFARLDAGALSSAGGFSDLLYQALRILRLGVPDAQGDPFLETGRWVGVLFLFSALVAFLVPRLEFSWRRLLCRLARGHTLIVGSGEQAQAFMRDYATRTRVLMTDEPDLDAHDFERPPNSRLPLYLSGKPVLESTLEAMSAPDAERVIIAAGSDALNLEISHKLIGLADGRARRQPLVIITHLEELNLVDGLSETLQGRDSIRLRPVSLPHLASRTLLSTHPFLLQGWYGSVADPHWLFAGFDAYAQALLVLGLRMRPPVQGAGLRVTVMVEDPAQARRQLLQSHPGAGDLFDSVRFVTAGIDGWPLPTVPGADAQARWSPTEQQTAIMVFAARDIDAFKVAQRLRVRSRIALDWQVPMFVRLDNARHWLAAIKPLSPAARADEVIEPFGSQSALCTSQCLGDWQEAQAERLHEGYVARFGAQSRRSALAEPGTRPWAALTEQLREANRRAIENFPVKLAALGYHVAPGAPVLSVAPRLDEPQKAFVARFEHASWSADKRLAGWSFDAVRNDRRQLHDCLTDFDALGEEQKKDIVQFETIVEQLVRDGTDGDGQCPALPQWRLGLVIGHELTPASAAAIAQALPARLVGAGGPAGASSVAGPSHLAIWVAVPRAPDLRVLAALLPALDAQVRANPGGGHLVVFRDRGAVGAEAGGGLDMVRRREADRSCDELVSGLSGLARSVDLPRGPQRPVPAEPGAALAWLAGQCDEVWIADDAADSPVQDIAVPGWRWPRVPRTCRVRTLSPTVGAR